MDNILKPILITRGANLHLLLVFVGVVGGMFAFGLIGIFIGPVVLAAGWTLLQNWVIGVPPGGVPVQDVAELPVNPG
jgi:predicted PurR-regulated permease PerM